MRTAGVALTIGLAWGLAAPARADVRITISDGYASVDAKDATVRQILTEWARVGQTKVVNSERIAGAPLSLYLVRVPEAEALAVILRSVSGYMVAPRAVPVPNASQFDRILVMPTSTPPRTTATPAAQPAPSFPQPVQTPEEVEIEDPGLPPGPGGTPGRGPIFPQFPVPPGQVNPNAPAGQRGPAFPTANGPFPINQVAPQQGPAGQTAPPPFTPGQFPPAQGFPGAVGAPGRGVMPAGVPTPGMVVQPPAPGAGTTFEPQD